MKNDLITKAYNGIFERSPQPLVKAFVKYLGLPNRDIILIQIIYVVFFKYGKQVIETTLPTFDDISLTTA